MLCDTIMSSYIASAMCYVFCTTCYLRCAVFCMLYAMISILDIICHNIVHSLWSMLYSTSYMTEYGAVGWCMMEALRYLVYGLWHMPCMKSDAWYMPYDVYGLLHVACYVMYVYSVYSADVYGGLPREYGCIIMSGAGGVSPEAGPPFPPKCGSSVSVWLCPGRRGWLCSSVCSVFVFVLYLCLRNCVNETFRVNYQ